MKKRLNKGPKLYFKCAECEKDIPVKYSVYNAYGQSFCCERCSMFYHNKLVDAGKSLCEKFTDKDIEGAQVVTFSLPRFEDTDSIEDILKNGTIKH